MAFVYHARPPGMRGSALEPLSALRARHPDLHAAGRAKYEGERARNLEIRVPGLDAMWDEVVHLMPLHPGRVYRAQLTSGLEPERLTFFRVPVDRLPSARTAWFRFDLELGLDEHLGQPAAEQFAPFDPTRYRELPDVPERTRAYYEAAVSAGLRPLPYRFIPQVLVAGAVDVAGAEVVDWADGAGE
jgi:hypothetical protein